MKMTCEHCNVDFADGDDPVEFLNRHKDCVAAVEPIWPTKDFFAFFNKYTGEYGGHTSAPQYPDHWLYLPAEIVPKGRVAELEAKLKADLGADPTRWSHPSSRDLDDIVERVWNVIRVDPFTLSHNELTTKYAIRQALHGYSPQQQEEMTAGVMHLGQATIMPFNISDVTIPRPQPACDDRVRLQWPPTPIMAVFGADGKYLGAVTDITPYANDPGFFLVPLEAMGCADESMLNKLADIDGLHCELSTVIKHYHPNFTDRIERQAEKIGELRELIGRKV